jgi:uncharacterized protein (DUF1697 family)
MTTYVALLRAINLGGRNKVPMKELKALCSEIGLENPRTVLASGNLVFEATKTSAAKLRAALQEGVEERFGVSAEIIVLSAAEFRKVLADDPLQEKGRKIDWLTVMFVSEPPSKASQKAFLEAHTGPEEVAFGEHAVYIYYSEGIGRSRLDLGKMKPPLKGTVRNRNTLGKLLALLDKG